PTGEEPSDDAVPLVLDGNTVCTIPATDLLPCCLVPTPVSGQDLAHDAGAGHQRQRTADAVVERCLRVDAEQVIDRRPAVLRRDGSLRHTAGDLVRLAPPPATSHPPPPHPATSTL